MKNLFKTSSLIAVLLLVLTGCGVAPIYNVQNAQVEVKKNTSNEQIYKAIKRAGASLGWIITKTSNNEAKGILNLRTHQAVVRIPFNSQSYSILYENSVNLKCDGQNIHSNYNGWIQNLKKAIDVQLSLLSE